MCFEDYIKMYSKALPLPNTDLLLGMLLRNKLIKSKNIFKKKQY